MDFSKRSKLIHWALILSGIEGLGVLAHLVLTKSAEGAVLFGLSITRLVLAAGILVTSLLLLGLAIAWIRGGRLTGKLGSILETHSSPAIFILSWALTAAFILQREPFFQILVRPIKPFYTIEYYSRFQWVLIWLLMVVAQITAAVILAYWKQLSEIPPKKQPFFLFLIFSIRGFFSRDKDQVQQPLRTVWRRHKTSLLVFLSMGLLWIFIAATGIGIVPDDRYWNIAGVPILWHQMVFVILLILFILDLKQILDESKLLIFTQKPAFPYLLLVLIWLAAVLVWQGEDLTHTYFAVNTPPNNVTYPFSDAMVFDVGGQYFLMGEGLNNEKVTDRPYLMLYDAFLHLLGGQQYEKMVFFQILLLALIPAIIFLIGWKLDSKTMGTAAAFLIILKEKNAIGSAFQAGLANPKVLTSELPNALLLVLAAFCLLKWFRQTRNTYLWPILAGGFVGLAVGVRGNSLTIIPLVLLLALLALRRHPRFLRQWALTAVIFLFGAIAVLTPYSIKSAQEFGAPFWLIKVQDVLDRAEFSSTPLETATRLGKPARQLSQDEFPMLTARHFLHNEITTVLMLPIRWQATSLNPALDHPIWDNSLDWAGSLTTGEKLALGMNLLILAFGIGSAFHRWQITGLTPLTIHLTYNLTNAAARTSGGRYLVPTDWVLFLYFILGVGTLIYILRGWKPVLPAGTETEAAPKEKIWMPVLALVGFLLIGSAYLISDLIQPPFDLGSGKAKQTYLADSQDLIIEAGIDFQQLKDFIAGDAIYSIGVALYPRYYEAGENVPASSYLPDIPTEDAHLYFMMLEDKGPRHVSIPLTGVLVPDNFPHGAYGLIVGCEKAGYTEGVVFIPLDSLSNQIFTRSNLTLNCD